ncbi:MAG: universal stress protein [Candidatus Heimdallarchaeaceae archaeon]
MKWKVLVVVDESAAGRKAIDCAVDLCLAGFNSKFYILYIKDISIYSEEERFYSPFIIKANRTLTNIADRLKSLKVDFEVIGYHFGVVEEIERVEKELEIDMIIIGAQKLILFNRLLGGHYSEKMVFETKSPVLIVKPEYKSKIGILVKVNC